MEHSLSEHDFGCIRLSGDLYRFIITHPVSEGGPHILTIACPVRRIKWTTSTEVSGALIKRQFKSPTIHYKFVVKSTSASDVLQATVLDVWKDNHLAVFISQHWVLLFIADYTDKDALLETVIQQEKRSMLVSQFEQFKTAITKEFQALKAENEALKADVAALNKKKAVWCSLKTPSQPGGTNTPVSWGTDEYIDGEYFSKTNACGTASASITVLKAGVYQFLVTTACQSSTHFECRFFKNNAHIGTCYRSSSGCYYHHYNINQIVSCSASDHFHVEQNFDSSFQDFHSTFFVTRLGD